MNDILFSAHTPDHRFTLKDGSICRIRAIGRGDRHLLQAGFARLSPQSRRLRFFNAKQSLTNGELDFLTGADGHNHIPGSSDHRHQMRLGPDRLISTPSIDRLDKQTFVPGVDSDDVVLGIEAAVGMEG